MNYIVGKNSNQIQMIALEQLVAPDSWARIIDLFVDILPIDKLGVKMSNFNQKGDHRIICNITKIVFIMVISTQ